MTEFFTPRRGIDDEVGDGRDKVSKDEVLEGNASSRSDCSENRNGQDDLFISPCIGEYSLYSLTRHN